MNEYTPWQRCNIGEVMHLKLVMADGSSYYVNYIQIFDMELDDRGNLLMLLFENRAENVRIEGDKLHLLANLITERKVKSIHVYDYEGNQSWDEAKGYVSAISFEENKSS